MVIQDIEDLSAAFADVLNECARRGMAPPFIVVSVSRNGSVIAIRVFLDSNSEAEVLVEHFEVEGFAMPINIMVLDQNNDAARITIEAGAVVYH